MNPELTKKLLTDYPKLFPDERFPFECGDGWFHLIHNLCGIIQQEINHRAEVVRKAKESNLVNPMQLRFVEEWPQITVLQVKEKFGGLRFYYAGADANGDLIHNYVTMAEYISVRTCEECGQPGTKYHDGWIKTLCPDHAKEQNRSNEFITDPV